MITGVRCRWLNPGQEEIIPLQACHACADDGRNPCGYPAPLLQVMTRNRNPAEVSCSSTMFGGCPRQHGIQKHVDYAIDPDTSYTRGYGSIVHLGMEMQHKQRPGNAVMENRYRRDITLPDGRTMTVSAAMDVMHLRDGKAVIRDYKVIPSIAPSHVRRRLHHYVSQFSIQRWILAGHDIEVEEVELQFLAHGGKRNVNLFPNGDEEFSEARLMSMAQTEQYLLEKGPALLDSLEGHYAPPLTEDLWRCSFCDVRKECESLYGGPIPASQQAA